MASKMKSLYVCQNCGYENPKWYGKCPQCGEWDTMQEEVRVEQKGNTAAARAGGLGGGTRGVAQKISEIQTVGEHRYHTGLSEFDRVLGCPSSTVSSAAASSKALSYCCPATPVSASPPFSYRSARPSGKRRPSSMPPVRRAPTRSNSAPTASASPQTTCWCSVRRTSKSSPNR